MYKFEQITNTKEMSNLITDMTIKGGGSSSELAEAIRHSITVMDDEKSASNSRQKLRL